ncbi:MAG: hypothetical protein IJ600_08075 [Lachnospiraceae bacterium]|nr:hypothetical protein [Lachnospiraceae bacterium]
MVPVNLSFLSIIQDILRWVFESVLMPVIKDVFNILVTLIGELILAALSGIFLELWVIILKIIDFLEDIFTIFSGMTQLQVNGEMSNQGIVQYLFGLGAVQRTFLAITVISVVLCFATTMIAVLRSLADTPFENKKPISAVLQTTLKCVLHFTLMQFACIFAIQMTTQVLLQINYSLNVDRKDASMGDQLFYLLVKDKVKGGTNVEYYAAGARYANVQDVMKHFDYMHFNWIIVIVSSVFVLGILLATILSSVQRLFMLMILYVISPLFVAYMPLDEGKSFGQWRDTFVGYLIAAFSPILAMKLFMMFLPMFMDGKMQFPNGINMMYVNIIFIISGALAIYTSRNLFVKIVHPSLGAQLDGNGQLGSKVGALAFGRLNALIGKLG